MKILAFLISIILLTSCDADQYNVKLPNSSIVQAFDNKNRNYESGDTVCIKKIDTQSWYIDDNGNMLDTIYSVEYTDSSYFFVNYEIGVIK